MCQASAQQKGQPGVRPPLPGDVEPVTDMERRTEVQRPVLPGAYSIEKYVPLLKVMRVGLVVNHTSMVGSVHLVDTLRSLGVNIATIFAPEHGFRGQADAGAEVPDEVDPKTGIKIVSLYGDKKKPSAADLQDIDIMVFDIQDVGVRFYTYLATMLYVMEAVAAQEKVMMVLDRPNPNGHYIDGPVLDTTAYKSFVGPLPIPVVYGMTLGEMGQMIKGEGWVGGSWHLEVIPCQHYDHNTPYHIPVRPSPNLPNQRSVLLYPGICFFEGTVMSLGRGTKTPFQVVGHPDYPDHSFSFTPVSLPGAKNPPLKDKKCYGLDLTSVAVDSLYRHRQMDLSVLLKVYRQMDQATFFNAAWFDKLAGTDRFRKAIEQGRSEDQIRASWQADLDAFNERRKRYLIYKDF